MKLNWLKTKLTFVIIPEANGSVMKVKLPRAAVLGAAVSAALLVGAALIVHFFHMQTAVSASIRSSELHGENVRLAKALSKKNETIERLQNEVFSLSKQAAEIRSKVEEMKKLEQDLKALAPAVEGNGPSAASAAPPP
ncbi:hypothetical protein LJK88_45005 [Paenibacillus sp. P26]|nr:hypothetical protein LJK88_45005 [Paenibacillus sp. P26]